MIDEGDELYQHFLTSTTLEADHPQLQTLDSSKGSPTLDTPLPIQSDTIEPFIILPPAPIRSQRQSQQPNEDLLQQQATKQHDYPNNSSSQENDKILGLDSESIKPFLQLEQHLIRIQASIESEIESIQVQKQIVNDHEADSAKNTDRETNLMNSIAYSQQKELLNLKETQIEQYQAFIKQRDDMLQKKDDELKQTLIKVASIEEKLQSSMLEIIDLRQLSKRYSNLIDEQKYLLEKKITIAEQNQQYTSEINSNWRTGLHEQRAIVEELQRTLSALETRLRTSERENESLVSKNNDLNSVNYGLREQLEELRRESELALMKSSSSTHFHLNNSHSAMEEQISNRFHNRDSKLILTLATYQKELKEVFEQISNNPIIEKYKQQNDDLLSENMNLQDQVLRLKESLHAKEQEEDRNGNNGEMMENTVGELSASAKEARGNALKLYENMMEKFAEMDARMVSNDSEKFEAISQKDFWFGKAQAFESEIERLKESLAASAVIAGRNDRIPAPNASHNSGKNTSNLCADEEDASLFQFTTATKKSIPSAGHSIAMNGKTKKRKGSSTRESFSDCDDERVTGSGVLSTTEKRVKPNNGIVTAPSKEQVSTSPLKLQSVLIIPGTIGSGAGQTDHSDTISRKNSSTEQINYGSSSNSTGQSKSQSGIAQVGLNANAGTNSTAGKSGMFQLRICSKCSLTIKKNQQYESCSICAKDYHLKCKVDSIEGTQHCQKCVEKHKKKAADQMEVESYIEYPTVPSETENASIVGGQIEQTLLA